ncbi:hypothetical protein BD779DRAFT_1473544 [Infundibulicybe gibba]|nr:hypothetical protein BD779DRAFT_1473544 [Infundibulicybe gibba]
MPSDSYATAFMMTMCYEQHPGAAPWDDPAILLALQISHPNAGKKQLGLPESKSRAVHAFISAVRNRMLAVRSDYIKEGDCDDGRISYVKWFRKVSLVLNTIVEHELMEADIHPTQVIAKIGKDEFPCLEYWQAWSHTLGEIVFGTSVMNLAGFVDSDAVSSVARIISYNLLRLRRQWKSARGRIGKHRQLALECMEADLQAAMAAVKIWQAASLWFPQEGKLIEGHIVTIEALFGTIGHSSGREEEQLPDELAGTVAKARLAASHKRMIATDLANEEQVAQTWREFVEYFVRTRTDRTTRPAVEIDLADLDLELGAIGVCTMSKYTESQLELLLGFPDGRPPHWATLRSDNPELTSWDPGSASAYTIDGPGMANNQQDPGKFLYIMINQRAQQDTVWSELTTVQIIGRAHRLGQKKEVHVYKLAALGTTDVIMSSLARSKDEMLNALVSQNTDPDLEKLLRHEVDDANISDDDGEASSLGLEPPIRQGRRKRATKAKKEGDAKAPLRAVGTGKLKAKRSGKGTHKDPIDLVDNGALLSGPSTTSMGSADSPTHQDGKKPAPYIRQITPDHLLRLASHHSVLEVSDHPADQLPRPEIQCSTHIEPPRSSKLSTPSPTPSQRSPTPSLGSGPISMTASSLPLDLSKAHKAQVAPVRDGAQVHGTCPPCPPASSPPQPTSPLPSPPLGSVAALGSNLVLPSPLGSPAYSTSGTQLAPVRVEPACEPSMSPQGPPLPALLLNSSQVSESSPTRNRTPRPRPRPTNITSLGKRPAVDSPPMPQTPRPTNITSLGKRPAADSLPNPRPSQRPWATFDRSASLHGNPPSDDDDDEDDGRGFRLIQQTRAAIQMVSEKRDKAPQSTPKNLSDVRKSHGVDVGPLSSYLRARLDSKPFRLLLKNDGKSKVQAGVLEPKAIWGKYIDASVNKVVHEGLAMGPALNLFRTGALAHEGVRRGPLRWAMGEPRRAQCLASLATPAPLAGAWGLTCELIPNMPGCATRSLSGALFRPSEVDISHLTFATDPGAEKFDGTNWNSWSNTIGITARSRGACRAHATHHVWRATHSPVFYKRITLEYHHPCPCRTLVLRPASGTPHEAVPSSTLLPHTPHHHYTPTGSLAPSHPPAVTYPSEPRILSPTPYITAGSVYLAPFPVALLGYAIIIPLNTSCLHPAAASSSAAASPPWFPQRATHKHIAPPFDFVAIHRRLPAVAHLLDGYGSILVRDTDVK